MQHLFSAWPAVAAKLASAGHVLLLSDFDGTLTPLSGRPQDARLSRETRTILQALARHKQYTVGVISGRSLRDLKEQVGLTDVVYGGNHGLEIEAPGLHFVSPVAQELRPLFDQISAALRAALAGMPGAVVENKGLTLSLHYRLVDQQRLGDVRRAFEEVTREHLLQGRIRMTEGKKMYEARPVVEWDKGNAIDALVESRGRAGGQSSPLAVFLGDDITDEDGFKAVERHSGISIFVGEEGWPTAARYRLASPEEVQEFLRRLLAPASKDVE